jgi:hypothetical protein
MGRPLANKPFAELIWQLVSPGDYELLLLNR